MRRETTQPGTPYAAGVESDFLSLLVCASSVRETDKSGGAELIKGLLQVKAAMDGAGRQGERCLY